MIRVMLVDDQEMLRAGLRSILSAHPDIEVVAEASHGAAAIDQLSVNTLDVILMDIRMPGIDGVEATRRIRQKYSPQAVKILVLTTFDQDANVLEALRAGADGFLSKGAGPQELTQAIMRVAQGEHALSSSAVDALIDHAVVTQPPKEDPHAVELFSQLTQRELEVVQLIVDGLNNQAIADRLFVSPYTVKTHANRAMMKVSAKDRAQLVSLAFRAGITPA